MDITSQRPRMSSAPRPLSRHSAEDAPIEEYLTQCIRWGYVFFALARRAQLAGRWDMAERFRDDGEFVFETLEILNERR